jgi:outer membrane protein OmpA-like peptidoglycan-associated protein/tetratricopeptide (TPR) repeat protein
MKFSQNLYKLLTAVFLFSISFNYLSAQDVSKDFKKLSTKAQEFFDAEDYENALVFALKADALKPKDPALSNFIALIYINESDELKALPYLIAAKEGGVKDPKLSYNLGVAYHLAHRFPEAVTELQKYRATLKPSEIEELAEVDRILDNCKQGDDLIKKPVKVKIRNLGPAVNSKYPDYVPAISADETTLLFTSRRDNTTGGQKAKEDDQYYEDIYISVKSNDSTWTTAVGLGNGINTPSHDACVGISPDGQEMYIYRVTPHDGGDLFSSDLKGAIWSAPKSLGPNINTTSWEPSASITSDDKVLFFTSNRKGGFGGRDIYMSKRLVNGEFGPPVHLGPRINTKYEEDSPFIHADGKTLYFSSKGHKSMGGFDIFSCTINTETGEITSDPVNIGYPINTADDDIFFVWSADNKRAYFSSVREGGYGDKDLYVLERDEANAALVVFKGRIFGCDDKNPVAATIIVTDNSTGKPVGVYNSNSSTGRYTVILPAGKDYGIAVEAPHYLFYSKHINIPFLDHYLEIQDTVCLQKIKIGTTIVLRNVFFDVDKATLTNQSEAELQRLYEILKDNAHIKIQISGHTDSDGNDEHNLKLSDARAKAVVDYLLKKNIPVDRLKYKGYGETKPVAPNDTPENKHLNRRTEFEIIGD